MRITRTTLTAVLGLALIAASAPTAAAASTLREPVDPVIVEMLEEVPGGVLVDADHAVLPELDMELRTASAANGIAARAVGSCATGRLCAYDDYNRTGRTLSWGTCGNIAIPSSFVTRSAANARTSGSMEVRSGTTVRATIAANSWANVYGSANNILCYL